MPRMARVMFEDWPFHITHRANERRTILGSDKERRDYLLLLKRYSQRFEMAIWAYCLMENHVHLISVGRKRNAIPRAVGNTHRNFSRNRNGERDVTGHLWANRFFSTALDETHLWTAVRYVELNPVRAGLVRRATDYPWSSARFHAGLESSNPLLDSGSPFPGPIGDWSTWLNNGLEDAIENQIRENTYSGRPTGSDLFLSEIEQRLGRSIRRVRP